VKRSTAIAAGLGALAGFSFAVIGIAVGIALEQDEVDRMRRGTEPIRGEPLVGEPLDEEGMGTEGRWFG
jgi:outer membrane protein assembly factor BamE (lipoprotein component of BamABCDE complex)